MSQKAMRGMWPSVFVLGVAMLSFTGCGGGGNADSGNSAPQILAEPKDQSVPLGLEGTFNVKASGGGLHFQWYRNGSSIGTDSPSYTTPDTVLSDDGSSYTLSVSNSLGSVASSIAKLKITGRAPLSGDLRFHLVDAPATVNGFGGGNLLNISGPGFYTFANGFGVLLTGPACSASRLDVYGCYWLIEQYTSGETSSTISGGVDSGSYSEFDSLASGQDTTFGSFTKGNRVIQSLDLEASSNAMAVSWIDSSVLTGYQMVMGACSPADLASLVSTLASSGRVITAVSFDGSSVRYVAYSWASDGSTAYDSVTLMTPLASASDAVAQLSAQGYILTALGGNASKGAILIGTKVHGDVLARPSLTVPYGGVLNSLNNGGYMPVGWVYDYSGSSGYSLFTALGQR